MNEQKKFSKKRSTIDVYRDFLNRCQNIEILQELLAGDVSNKSRLFIKPSLLIFSDVFVLVKTFLRKHQCHYIHIWIPQLKMLLLIFYIFIFLNTTYLKNGDQLVDVFPAKSSTDKFKCH